MSDEIEYAVNPNPDAGYKRETFSWDAPSSFLSSIVRAELGPAEKTGNFLDDFFRISQRGSTVFTEITGEFLHCF